MLPCGDHGLVVTKELNALAGPAVTPGEGSCQDGKQFFPLNRLTLLVWLPGVVEPATLEVGSTTECPGGVGIELEVWGCRTVGVEKVGRPVPRW